MSLAQSLIGRGYFPAEVPTPFTTESYASNLDKLPKNLNDVRHKSSRCAYHSIPRLQHFRRLLGIPNPLHQLKLARLVEEYWSQIEEHMDQSRLSLTRLRIEADSPRALTKLGGFDDLET